MFLFVLFLLLLVIVIAATAIGAVIVLRERMPIDERLDHYCRKA